MQTHDVARLDTDAGTGRTLVRVREGRGEELRHHLASHGIRSELAADHPEGAEALVVGGDTDPLTLQAILDQWER